VLKIRDFICLYECGTLGQLLRLIDDLVLEGGCHPPPGVLKVRLSFPSHYVSDGGLFHFWILRLFRFLLVFFRANAYGPISVWTRISLKAPSPRSVGEIDFVGSKLTLCPPVIDLFKWSLCFTINRYNYGIFEC